MKSLENVSNNHRKEDLKLLFYGILVGIAFKFLSLYYSWDRRNYRRNRKYK